jgi:phospholipase C
MNHKRTPWSLAVAGLFSAALLAAPAGSSVASDSDSGGQAPTATPIKHLVVIYQENVSFDHYFGTYPIALNPPGEPRFTALANTPTVNGLCSPVATVNSEGQQESGNGSPRRCDPNSGLINANPNNPEVHNPQRLDRSQALTCDQNHDYTAEQTAYDHGMLDRFALLGATGKQDSGTVNCDPNQVMDYYDGNTVTALWNYAQHFAMNDNSYSTQFGPSTPGALNLVAGNSYGATCGEGQVWAPSAPCTHPYNSAGGPGAPVVPPGTGTVYGDPRPNYDMCSAPFSQQAAMGGRNIGNILNGKELTWGWFQGGFASACSKRTPPSGASPAYAGNVDYIPHHEPFQYYASTSNPNHLPPTSVDMVGRTDQANHQYDLTNFWAALDAGNMPAVSFLKAPGYQDGHAGYSTPLDEQRFLVETINRLQQTSFWKSTAVVIAYDDSDGWYDHAVGPVLIHSQTAVDTLSNPSQCGAKASQAPPAATNPTTTQQARCGFGPRQPFLLISPFAKRNFVDNTLTSQSSILRFIEDNWLNGQRIGQGSADTISGTITNMFDFNGPRASRLILDPSTGQPTGNPD